MSQNNSTGNQAGNSRAKGAARSKGSAGKNRSTTAGSKQTKMMGSNSVHRSRKNSSRNHRSRYEYKKIFVGGLILITAIAVIVFLMKTIDRKKEEAETGTEAETTVPETQLQTEVTVDGIKITGLSREEAKSEILKRYPWTMMVTYNGEVYEVTNLMAERVDELLTEIYTGTPKEAYVLDTSALDEKIHKEVEVIGEKWDKSAKNGSIASYDAASDTFVFSGAQSGYAIDRDKLFNDITAAISAKKFDQVVAVTGKTVEPEFTEAAAREKYKTIGTFTTTTTANSNRNTNIKLSSGILNGTIVQPGEEFSFNETVGERTEAKGYKGAAAYNNGLVVEEIGGGVCQLSSTLYNAVIKAGLKTTVRRSHTFEPSYVTPGTDATVSWGAPDYKFVNTSATAIGIRAHYADQKVTVSIYGIPVLGDGLTQTLITNKVRDIEGPAPTYEEDQTLQPDEERVKTAGSMGSYWETRLVVKKGSEIVSQEVIYNTTYRGHTAVILRNTSGIVVTIESEAETIEESSTPASEGAGDGFLDPEAITPPASSAGETTAASGPGSGGTASTTAGTTAGTPAGPGGAVTATTPAPATAAPTIVAPGSTTAASENSSQTVAPNPLGSTGRGSGSGPGQ